MHILRSRNRGTTDSPPVLKCRWLGWNEDIIRSPVHKLIVNKKPGIYNPWVNSIVLQHQLNAYCAVEVAVGWDIYVLERIQPREVGI